MPVNRPNNMPHKIMLSAIVAMAENRVIGRDNKIPWHIPADFRHFKNTTMGKPMVMGRKTFESLPGILPGRPHIILSRSNLNAEGTIAANTLDEALARARDIAGKDGQDEIMVIGGAQIFKECLPLLDRIYLSVVHKNYEGDTFFPELDKSKWQETERTEYEATETAPAWSALILDRQR